MKTLARLSFILLILAAGPTALLAQKATFTVKYSYANTAEGFDHQTKVQVYIDGDMVGESDPHPQTKPSSITVPVTPGKHSVRVVGMAYYEEQWEERTIDNNYSIDCIYEDTLTFKKKKTVTLIFDIDNGTKIKKVK